ncbi:metallophosphoesterase [Desulfonema ishimotonii]|uniref:Metallophosphoesterase n=1 Tax=Desulfonema ishimotonii TaxID=45657 RepID=A0A401G278_9BACT|nr:metallophosphoesterase [Desulfonema ishimotonii]GBC63305.1 metallophosphoesterase [Desulfonema ishimotonii]
MDRRSFLKLALTGGMSALAASYPVFIERQLVRINTYKIPVPRLPEAFENFTIVQLTDLHYGFLVSLSFLRNVIRRANAISKDIVVCTGDYVHERDSVRQIDGVWPEMGKLEAPLGAYSVLGNHDHLGNTDRSVYWLNRTGQNLRHGNRCFERGKERLWLVGAGDLWEDHADMDRLMRDIPDDECRIVLAHNPDTADTACKKRTDLFICGHTHGGQVSIPFYGPPVLPVKNRAYSAGLKRSEKGTPVFISRGIGWSIYPVRFNCAPEIAVLKLVRGV